MNHILLGNLFSLFAMGSDALSASRKTARGILLVQILSQIFYGISAIVLKGYSGAVQNGVSLIRNLFAIGKKEQKILQWLLLAAAVGFGLYFNNLGLLGWLPVVANVEYSLAVLYFSKNEYALKLAFAVNVFMFGIFNFAIQNYIAVGGNLFVFIMTVIYLIKERRA